MAYFSNSFIFLPARAFIDCFLLAICLASWR